MEANRKENIPPWPGGYLKSDPRLVLKNVSIGLPVASGRDTTAGSCSPTRSQRQSPTAPPGRDPGRGSSQGSGQSSDQSSGRGLQLEGPVASTQEARYLSFGVQTNLAPASQSLLGAAGLVSNSCFEQQSNLWPQARRPRASGKWMGLSSQQSNVELSRADPERRGGARSPHLKEPAWSLGGCSQELLWPGCSAGAPWSDSQTHRPPLLRDRPSSSFPGPGNSVHVSPRATKAWGSELSFPPPSGHQSRLFQPSTSYLDYWTPNSTEHTLPLEDLTLSGQYQQSSQPPVLEPRAELSPDSAHLRLSMRSLRWPTELLFLRAPQEHTRPWPCSSGATSPGASPTSTPGHPGPFTCSCGAVSPEVIPHLAPGQPSSLTHPCGTVYPEATPRLAPGHPSPCRAVPPEVTPYLTPGHPSPLGLSHSTASPEVLPNLTMEYPSLHILSDKTLTPETSPKLASGYSSRTRAPEASPSPTSGSPNPLPLSYQGSQVDRGQQLIETQLEGHVWQIWHPWYSQGTNTPLPGPVEGTAPTHWRSPREGTFSGPEGSSGPSLLQSDIPGPCPFGQEGRLGLRTCLSASSSIGAHLPAQQQLEKALWPREWKGPWMERGLAENHGARSWDRRKQHLAVGSSQQELGLEKKSSISLIPEAGESRALLSCCFKTWHCHLLRQWAMARALRRRHLLRKGLRAMRWALWLREAQMEFMKRKQRRTVLARSFRKWKDLYLNRRERKLLTQCRTDTPQKDFLLFLESPPERAFVTLGMVHENERAPKSQLHPRWKSSIQDPRTPATPDFQRLAAFHLWHLQKALAEEIHKDAQVQAELGKKKLRRVFQAWRARTLNAARICPLVTRHQRARLGRCFEAWRRHAQRRTQCHGRLARWRVETLRKSLQQWVKMVWLQAGHSRAVEQLYLHRQKSWHLEVAGAHKGSSRGLVSFSPGEQDQPCRRLGLRALEEACQKLKLHRVVLLWSRRLAQHRRADSFSQKRKLRILQKALQRWRRKAQAAGSPPARSANCPREPFAGSQDSEERPPSSGCSSNAPSAPRSSSEGARSPTDRSHSFLSPAGDGVLPLHLRSLSLETPDSWKISFPLGQRWPQLWDRQPPGPWRQLLACLPPEEEPGPLRKAVQVPRDPSPWQEARWQRGAQEAPELEQLWQVTLQICHFQVWRHLVLTTLNLWVRLWTLRAIQRRTFTDPAELTDPQEQDWKTAGNQIPRAQQQDLLRSPWTHRDSALPRGMPGYQLTTDKKGTSVGPGPSALHPRRLALRADHTLGADPDALCQQAGNYWTRATALAPDKRKSPSHIGQRKMSAILGGSKQSFLLPSLPCLPLHCRRTSQEKQGKAPREPEGSSRKVRIPKSRGRQRAAVLEETWLERKYLQRWRHKVLLQRFYGQRRRRRLAEVWQSWVEAQGSEQLAQTLVRQRWLEWGWRTWRRRWLQLQVALRLREDHSVLSQAFGRWYQRWAARVPGKGSAGQGSGVSMVSH
ncbi:uncharacterized protein C1orf167 homolog [Sminthopsis crassicaudata]|uniref:uncharacterized protein C1orf167 homolog n=1 Tax=Sminthopsis crassicaudata TaxID=9301 RepID=UPI003D68EFC7